jgi:hypothetical protein
MAPARLSCLATVLAAIASPSAVLAQASPAREASAPALDPPAAPSSPALPTGDAMVGRALFIGARAFRNGASPCGACHAIGGESAPFAASLGPELSRSFEGLDADAVSGMLEDPPFPTMAPLYAGRPLTPDERADVAAFLLQASGKPAPGGARVAVWATVLMTAVLAALGLAERRRPGPARAELIARARLASSGRRRGGAPSTTDHLERTTPAPAAPRAQGGAR